MSISSSPPMNPDQPYIHTDYCLNWESWLRLQKLKYHLWNTPNKQLSWGNFPMSHNDQSNINGTYSLINIRQAQEHVSAQMENILNSLLLGLIDRDINQAILAKPLWVDLRPSFYQTDLILSYQPFWIFYWRTFGYLILLNILSGSYQNRLLLYLERAI